MFGLENPDVYAIVYQGGSLAQEGKLAGAITVFHQALKLEPRNAKAQHNLGIALSAKGQLADGVRNMQAALDLQRDYAEAHYNLGTLYNQMGRRDGANE